MKMIQLSGGRFAMVDDCDYEELGRHSWHASHNGYAIRRDLQPDGRKPMVYMHRVIFGEDWGGDVDHADGNRLNNCLSNLRSATRSQNNANARMRGGSSRFKGVCWHKQISRWIAYINVNGKRRHLGSFSSEREAAEAYNEAAKTNFGAFARINVLGG